MAKQSKSTNSEKRPAPARHRVGGEEGAGTAPGHTSAKVGDQSFPIVGIGASAGGLEALEQFFGQVPDNGGIAFVVIQHLDPTHKDMLPELLQRVTRMKVFQAGSGMKVQPDCVYVIPPNKDLSILHGMLHLFAPQAPRGLRLPIDFFLRALADDQLDRSIGVILSGMGSDGTLGLSAIKEKAGLVAVQEPTTAGFDSMPRSAINAGLADIVAPAEELPGKIIEYIRHAVPHAVASAQGTGVQKGSLDRVFILLRARTGHDFSQYKKSTVYRRVERRMGLHQLEKIPDYARYLGENSQEIDLLFKELLIGVTNFFRDPSSWTYLQKEALPTLLASCPNGKVLRAWVVGCSTGEEAYSLAIAFREVVERVQPESHITLQIFATDLDTDAIDKARQGYYPANIAADVSAERLARFFVEEVDGYRVSKDIREMVVFAPQNVIMDPPFTKLDMLLCRNLLIYLGPELQKKLLPLFHYCLNPGGILFLGSSETIGGFTNLYTPLDSKARIYQRSQNPERAAELEFPSRLFPAQAGGAEEATALAPVANMQTLADQLLLEKFSPAAVLVNSEGDILYISGRTGKYLEPASGRANWNIYAMAREGLRYELATALPKALRNMEAITETGLRVDTGGGTQTINITVHAIEDPEPLRGMAMIVFHDVETPPPEPPSSGKHAAAPGRVAELEHALRLAREEMQTMREEMQTQQEELRSSNEELQSANEELQSSNEELTTSKEEMQSLNEELQTVNIELQAKVDELSVVNSDMKNLLNSTDIATVFLDNAMHVRRFTDQAKRIFKLIPSDVGRPLSDIVNDLDYPEMMEDAREVLRTLVFSEKQIVTSDGRWFMVKIMPYRTLSDMIDGVVITFHDITKSKNLEAELRKG